MTRVVLIGIAPDAVDLTDPDLPPGITHEQIAAGIETALADMRGRGWQADFCSLRMDGTAEATIAKSLATPCDCVVIGGGIRMPTKGLAFFETCGQRGRQGGAGHADRVQYATGEFGRSCRTLDQSSVDESGRA